MVSRPRARCDESDSTVQFAISLSGGAIIAALGSDLIDQSYGSANAGSGVDTGDRRLSNDGLCCRLVRCLAGVQHQLDGQAVLDDTGWVLALGSRGEWSRALPAFRETWLRVRRRRLKILTIGEALQG